MLPGFPFVVNEGVLNPQNSGVEVPLQYDGMVLWLAADKISGLSDGAEVTTWSDESGQGNDATEATNKPTYETNEQNGLPVVRFAGSDRLTVSGFGTAEFSTITEMTTFVVYNPEGDTGYNVLDLGTTGQHWRFSGDGGMYNSFFRSSRTVNSPSGQPSADAAVYFTLRSGPANGYDVRRNGSLVAEYTQSWGVASDDLILANGGDGGLMAGYICEVIIYNDELSDAAVSAIETYLVDKWGIT